MTEANGRELEIEELESQIADLKEEIAEQHETAEEKRVIDFTKIKGAIDDSARGVIDTIKPYIEKYQQPGKEAVAKVGEKVSDNPFLSVVIAFGAGIVIGKLLDLCAGRKD